MEILKVAECLEHKGSEVPPIIRVRTHYTTTEADEQGCDATTVCVQWKLGNDVNYLGDADGETYMLLNMVGMGTSF